MFGGKVNSNLQKRGRVLREGICNGNEFGRSERTAAML
jgi:hypothetical protein